MRKDPTEEPTGFEVLMPDTNGHRHEIRHHPTCSRMSMKLNIAFLAGVLLNSLAFDSSSQSQDGPSLPDTHDFVSRMVTQYNVKATIARNEYRLEGYSGEKCSGLFVTVRSDMIKVDFKDVTQIRTLGKELEIEANKMGYFNSRTTEWKNQSRYAFLYFPTEDLTERVRKALQHLTNSCRQRDVF